MSTPPPELAKVTVLSCRPSLSSAHQGAVDAEITIDACTRVVDGVTMPIVHAVTLVPDPEMDGRLRLWAREGAWTPSLVAWLNTIPVPTTRQAIAFEIEIEVRHVVGKVHQGLVHVDEDGTPFVLVNDEPVTVDGFGEPTVSAPTQLPHPVPSEPDRVVFMRDNSHAGTSVWRSSDRGEFVFASHDTDEVRTAPRCLLVKIGGGDLFEPYALDLDEGVALIGLEHGDPVPDGLEVLWEAAASEPEDEDEPRNDWEPDLNAPDEAERAEQMDRFRSLK